MRTFQLFTVDARRPSPVIATVSAGDEARARELARHELQSSPFHLAVEVREQDNPLFIVDIFDDREVSTLYSQRRDLH